MFFFLLYCEALSCRCECFVMQMVYVCVLCLVCILWQFLNAAFCMTFSLLILVEDARGNQMDESYSRAGLITAL